MSEFEIQLFDLTTSLSEATDLMDPGLSHHQRTVAVGSMALGHALGWSQDRLATLYIAASLHDVGALKLAERQALLKFETEDSSNHHAELGYRLLSRFQPFEKAAEVVRYHHAKWSDIVGNGDYPDCARTDSQIIHLVDRVAILIQAGTNILSQADHILSRVQGERGHWFNPELVDLLTDLSKTEVFWLDLASPFDDRWLRYHTLLPALRLDLDGLMQLGRMLAQLIDFRSAFTATHSAGVSAVAQSLASVASFAGDECRLFALAGLLHDLGKLAIPGEILEKRAGLSTEETHIIRSHTYYTHRILERISGLAFLNDWASLHHERPCGGGYPFAVSSDELSVGSRLMAVADVFTALTEDRPYRKGMEIQEASETLRRMAGRQTLDPRLVDLAIGEFQTLNYVRSKAQTTAEEEFHRFYEPQA